MRKLVLVLSLLFIVSVSTFAVDIADVLKQNIGHKVSIMLKGNSESINMGG